MAGLWARKSISELLRIKEPNLTRPFRTPAVFVVAPLGAASALFLMLGLPSDTWIRLAVWLVIGLAIYFTYGSRHSHLHGGHGSAIEAAS